MPLRTSSGPSGSRRVPPGIALRRVCWALAFWVNFRGACLDGGYFDADFYRRTAVAGQGGRMGRWFAQAWPVMHYLLFGHRAKLPPVAGYDHDRAIARFPFHKWVRLSPLEVYVLFGRLTGGEFLAPDPSPADPIDLPTPASDTALVVHAYHLAEFQQVLARLHALEDRVDLFVTTPHPHADVSRLCAAAGVTPRLIHQGPNRGRDVAPFCRLLNAGLGSSYAVVGKVHTKRSAHRQDGGAWFQSSLDALLALDRLLDAHARLSGAGQTGIVAPPGRLGPDPARTANKPHMAWMCARAGFGRDAFDDVSFPHGTMFWARAAVLQPLAELGLHTEDFEAEAGQLDGTLAHAIERMVGVSCVAAGYDQMEAGE